MESLSCVTCQRKIYTADRLEHIHTYAQLSVPLRGGKMNTINGSPVAHEPDCALFIPPNVCHSTFADRSNVFLMFNIPPAALQPFGNRIGCITRLSEKAVAAKRLIDLEVNEEPNDSAIITDMYMYLMRLFCREECPASVQYIHAHYMRSISVRQLAEMEHYHYSYYCDWFMRRYGQTPTAYITALRMEKAKRLLAGSRYTVLQTAIQLGYESESSFSKRFRAYTGFSPGQYRKQTSEN